MDKEDCFLRKLQPLSDLPLLHDKQTRFAAYNEKTIGFCLVSVQCIVLGARLAFISGPMMKLWKTKNICQEYFMYYTLENVY